jgi:hypothetical protein
LSKNAYSYREQTGKTDKKLPCEIGLLAYRFAVFTG